MLNIIDKDNTIKILKYYFLSILVICVSLLISSVCLLSINYKTYNNIKIIKEILSKQVLLKTV